MFGATSKVQPQFQRVQQAAETATYRNIRHAAFSISKKAKASIEKSERSSKPGSPPTTRGKGGHNLKGAIYTDADKDSAVIGPRASIVGDVGEAHEFGKSRKGDEFDERPFMGPALEASVDRFASDWHGSIG